MPDVHYIGTKAYTHRMQYPTTKFPIIDIGDTQEIDWPYRCGRSLVLRAPFSREALVLGVWTGQRDEEEALTHAIKAKPHVG